MNPLNLVKVSQRNFVFLLIISLLCSALWYKELFIDVRCESCGRIYFAETPDEDKGLFVVKGNGTKSYMIDTSTCKIPELNPWHNSTNHLWDCDTEHLCHDQITWMYTEGKNLIVNETAMNETGHKWENVRCCFLVMERVTAEKDSEEDYPWDADDMVKYSEECHPIEETRVEMDEEFIRVFCYSKLLESFNDVQYRGYFAFAKADSNATAKIEKWNSRVDKNGPVPPNVVILGVDSVSRLQSRRKLPKLLAQLEKLGAVEMVGHVKIGENTFPNTVGFMSGLFVHQLDKLCRKTSRTPQDNCPYVWKEFHKAGYITAYAEDNSNYFNSGFNYLNLGFVREPTDYYLRPFILNANEDSLFKTGSDCFGNLRRDEVVLKYILDVQNRGGMGCPVYMQTWFSTKSHDCHNEVGILDEAFTNFVQNLDLNNTILLFLSDHFIRYGEFRESTMGWYEDKLPVFWIYLPEDVKKTFPSWNKAVKANARRLTSQFDIYQTFIHILKAYGNENYSEPIDIGNFTRQGTSLLEPLPEDRTCHQAGIIASLCPCREPEILDLAKDNSTAVAGAIFALDFIRNLLPENCSRDQRVTEVVSASVVRFSTKVVVYVIRFLADPGGFHIEASVQRDEYSSGNFSIDSMDDIMRVNEMDKEVQCVDDSTWEKYCYCEQRRNETKNATI